MKLIEINAIKIAENRQRKYFDINYLRELSDSIQNRSLQNAPVLRIVGEDYWLVSGECRLRAIRDIYDLGGTFHYDGEEVRANFIPYTLLSDLDELAAEEAELEENIRRRDLTWQEVAAATARLRVLRTKQAEKSGELPPTAARLARELKPEATHDLSDGELGIYQAEVRQDLILAEHLSDPDVKAAKTRKEGWKILKDKEAKRKNRELAEQVGKIYTADVHQALNADSLTWLVKCPAEMFDVILTDPPYGMGAHEFGDSGGKAEGAHGYKDDAATFERIKDVCAEQFFRVAKPQAHLYWFCDIDWFFQLRQDLEMAGWEVFRTPLIWYKKAAFRAPWPEHGPQRKYETILFAMKGKRMAQKLAGDVLEFPADENVGHAAQKPVALFEELLKRSARPGDQVLDCFMGTGTIFGAADLLKCRATGVEMDPSAYALAIQRIQKMKEAA